MSSAPEAGRARAEWLAELERHRQPWGEWRALEAAVVAASFEVVEVYRGPAASPWHLATTADGGAARLWRLLAGNDERARRRRALSLAGLPSWLEAVMNVAWSPPCSGGAIGEALTGEVVDAAWLQANASYTGVLAPRVVSLPAEPVFTFQATAHGAPMIFCDRHRALVVDARAARFEPIGPLDVFVRHCLGAIVAGASWSETARVTPPAGLSWPSGAAKD